jgi:tRNA pseudouridine32 synthase/23S rRNA pseudouridine746 synthase
MSYIRLVKPEAAMAASGACVAAPEAGGLPEVVHVDGGVLVVNKPAGLLTQPGRGPHLADSLATRALAVFDDALIVHRLDMATSGLIVLARGREAHAALSRAFRDRRVQKHYVAVVDGVVAADAGEIDAPLAADWPRRPLQKVDAANGKPSRTLYRVIGRDAVRGTTRLALTPVTGRSHQLRVHLQALGHPILGDALYGGERVQGAAARLLLHATDLRFQHPGDGRELSFHSDEPF